ncbi:MAG: pentapeptide repeat-containing protein, partial [Hominilimicola sp.]
LLAIVNEGNGCTGLCNTGNRNTGNRNTGDWNTGDWNTGNWNTGFFNTITPPMLLFNKPTDLTREQLVNIKGVQVLNCNYENNWWIYSANMSGEEKKAHPEHEYTGGYLKSVSFKEACRIMWDKLTDEEKEAVKKIPNFDADVFKEITGVNVK